VTVKVRRITSPSELTQAFAIRLRVFVREQRVPAAIELDRDDARAIHFLAISNGRAAGTARLVMYGSSAKIGRMAVLKTYRNKGIGAALLKRTVAAAKRRHARKIYLHAQVPVIGFYEKFGFRCVGTVFNEAEIAHRKMILKGKLTTKNAKTTKNVGAQHTAPA
jgi:predicted GNAT family N-acyltransferase